MKRPSDAFSLFTRTSAGKVNRSIAVVDWLDNVDKLMGKSMVCQHWPACSLSDICFDKSTNKSFDIFSSRNDTAGQRQKAVVGKETVA